MAWQKAGGESWSIRSLQGWQGEDSQAWSTDEWEGQAWSADTADGTDSSWIGTDEKEWDNWAEAELKTLKAPLDLRNFVDKSTTAIDNKGPLDLLRSGIGSSPYYAVSMYDCTTCASGVVSPCSGHLSRPFFPSVS